MELDKFRLICSLLSNSTIRIYKTRLIGSLEHRLLCTVEFKGKILSHLLLRLVEMQVKRNVLWQVLLVIALLLTQG